jgi:hypothetical protein
MMSYIPHEKLSIDWINKEKSFMLSLPWVSMEIDVTEEDKGWIKDATEHLHSTPANSNVQRFIHDLKDYPVFYVQPRSLQDFKEEDLQPCPDTSVDTSTPSAFISTFGCEIEDELKKEILPSWTWDWEKILEKARIPETNLYDPVSFVSYLICYRLEWESTSWSGQDGFGQLLEKLLKEDEDQFFQAIGWVSKQSWYVTTTSTSAMTPALTHFEKAKDLIHHFICDEAGHYKFMEEVFRDINLNKEDFPVSTGTKWLLACHERTANVSPLAFSAMINLFEAAYYEGQDPISRVIKLSSKPHAAQGYDLHYKINQEHRHCDMPFLLAQRLAPQTKGQLHLTLALFELTLHFLDQMEKNFLNHAKRT